MSGVSSPDVGNSCSLLVVRIVSRILRFSRRPTSLSHIRVGIPRGRSNRRIATLSAQLHVSRRCCRCHLRDMHLGAMLAQQSGINSGETLLFSGCPFVCAAAYCWGQSDLTPRTRANLRILATLARTASISPPAPQPGRAETVLCHIPGGRRLISAMAALAAIQSHGEARFLPGFRAN